MALFYKISSVQGQVCRVWDLHCCTLEIFNRLLKLETEQKKSLLLTYYWPRWNLGTPSATYVRQFLFFYWYFYCLERERVCLPHKCGITYANSSVAGLGDLIKKVSVMQTPKLELAYVTSHLCGGQTRSKQ